MVCSVCVCGGGGREFHACSTLRKHARSRDNLKCKWVIEGNAWMTDHYTISEHNLDFVKERNPTSIHPHALSGEHQQTGGGLQHCCPICIKVQCHNVWSSKSTVCTHMLMSIYVSHVVVLQHYNYTAKHIHL